QRADEKLAAAQASQEAAVNALTEAQETFGAQQAELQKLTAERQAAQAKLNEVRTMSAATAGATSGANGSAPAAAPSPGAADGTQEPARICDLAPGGAVIPYGSPSQWEMTLPAIPTAFVSGDPIAIISASLQFAGTSAQVTAELSSRFLQRLGLVPT